MVSVSEQLESDCQEYELFGDSDDVMSNTLSTSAPLSEMPSQIIEVHVLVNTAILARIEFMEYDTICLQASMKSKPQ